MRVALRLGVSLLLALSPCLASCAFERLALSPCPQVGPAAPPSPCAHERDATDEPSAPDAITRFFAVGDAGVSQADQPAHLAASTELVMHLVRDVCDARGGCQFGVFLGDNVYETGVVGAPQKAFLESFARGYSNGWRDPLYFVLGNHDYSPLRGTNARAEAELLALTDLSADHGGMVRGRAHFFDFRAGPMHLAAWDTNYLVRACGVTAASSPACVAGGEEALSILGRSTSPFTIWLGHHPYWSNGDHGNAGQFLEFGFNFWPGAAFKELADRHVIGQADLMLSGHDHNLQVFSAPELRGTALVVSGAGAKSTRLRNAALRQPAWLAVDEGFGFTLVEATSSRLRVEMFFQPKSTSSSRPAGSEPAPRPIFTMCKIVGGDWQKGDAGACD